LSYLEDVMTEPEPVETEAEEATENGAMGTSGEHADADETAADDAE
jgi:hypothetical protein